MRFRDFAPTLWHLLGMGGAGGAVGVDVVKPARPKASEGSMRRRYDELVSEMKATYGVRVHRWRNSTSGCAWVVRYHDGTVRRLIEAPYPRGPVSCAVFLHEIGHHAIGWNTHHLRCLEEYDAWQWAIDTMRAKKLNVTPAVERRMTESVRWAIRKARRRGLKRLPVRLLPYVSPG